MIWKKMDREELIQDVVYQRVEMILEQHCMEKNGRKDLEREILARIVPGEEEGRGTSGTGDQPGCHGTSDFVPRGIFRRAVAWDPGIPAGGNRGRMRQMRIA